MGHLQWGADLMKVSVKQVEALLEEMA